MFIPGDIYTSSGSTKLYHCWTDKVTKYDSSSFYNWEQDNLPIYDLDERTHYLWEQLGHPTSSIPGVALVVSADAPASAVSCNKNIFYTLSAAIEALPQTINYPILIEIANFGQLGELILDGYKFGPRGSLEIINRNFSRQEWGFSSVGNSIKAPILGSGTFTSNPYQYLSGINPDATAYDATSIKASPLAGFLESSCMSIGAAVFSGTRDVRFSGVGATNSKLNGFISIRPRESITNDFTRSYPFSRSNLVIDTYNAAVQPYQSGNNYGINFEAYERSAADVSDEINSKDASTLNTYNSTLLNLGGGWTNYPHYNGLYYGNKIKKISVRNCGGPIFIRNFFLDGEGSARTDNNYGVDVFNCPNIFLENIVAAKYRKAGLNFNNSNVTLLRGCVATRIYDFLGSVRKTNNYDIRRNTLTFSSVSSVLNDDDAAGIVANNSTVTFSSTHERDYTLMKSVLGANHNPLPASYYIFEFNNNANGIVLNNSTLIGGKSLDINYNTNCIDYETDFRFHQNVGFGIIANNSKISLDGRIKLSENLNGMVLNNSVFEIDRLLAIMNQNYGLKSFNSKIVYNKNLAKYHNSGSRYAPMIEFSQNGMHLLLDNSNMMPTLASGIEESYERLFFYNPIRANLEDTDTYRGIVEAVKIQNNSNATFISPFISRHAGWNTRTFHGIKGSEIHAINNSTVNLRGTKYYCSKVLGTNQNGIQFDRGLAAICAENNSTVKIDGPTVIAKFGVDILADQNSKVIIGPPKDTFDQNIDSSSINLADSRNHTAVELHAVRSCIVADNNSEVSIKDLGSFRMNWSGSTDGSAIYNGSGPDYYPLNIDAIKFGSLQFYPNPTIGDGSDYASPGNSTGIKGQSLYSKLYTSNLTNQDNFTSGSRGLYFLQDLTTTPLGFSAVTYGGMCLRAQNNSIVNVHNVNFPTGWWSPSNAYYDGVTPFDSGAACSRLFVWNIADNSQLKASYLSISGTYPKNAGYAGPFGYWVSGATNKAASGMPSSTPDTSSLSVLDIFGQNPSGLSYTTTAADNYGVFRLYFSVDPMANSLTYVGSPGTASYGIISQIYSQGYQPSSNLLCSGPASSVYLACKQRNSAGSIQPSGYYYGKDMVVNSQYQRVLLDESAANTFANAKHCAAGKSNAAKTVSIYYPYRLVNQGDSAALWGIGSVNMFDIERNS